MLRLFYKNLADNHQEDKCAHFRVPQFRSTTNKEDNVNQFWDRARSIQNLFPVKWNFHFDLEYDDSCPCHHVSSIAQLSEHPEDDSFLCRTAPSG